MVLALVERILSRPVGGFITSKYRGVLCAQFTSIQTLTNGVRPELRVKS